MDKKSSLPVYPVTISSGKEHVAALSHALASYGESIRKSIDQMKQANVLAPWQKWSGDFINSDQWLVTLYNDLTGKKTGEFIKHN